MFNSFGNILRLTSFGESHGKGIGGVVDGFPAGITIDMDQDIKTVGDFKARVDAKIK